MSRFFGHAEERLDQKSKVNFEIYDVTWFKNNCNTHIDQYLKKGNQAIKLGQLIEYNMTNTFLEKSYTKCGGQTIP